ncbi:DUF6318 family protein [Bowdeniella massiliensis]|uniref:DUF6318 family protein n=1 Tax=Bowdeniella massiliensis TaxID=2932264 RepID=UPI00202948D1|nr:DUF6318 family protein [Bowdeniella massiliensis]
MTLVSRSLARTAAFALASALALSACTSGGQTDPPTSRPSTTTPTADPSSSESTPAPGEWTLDDLKVGAQVPKEDLERLFPAWDKPTPPATLTEESEQGAKDAAVYFSDIVEYAIATRDVTPINEIDSELCQNCDALRSLIKSDQSKRFLRTKPSFVVISASKDPDVEGLYDIRLQSQVDMYVRLDASRTSVEKVGSSGTEEVEDSEISQYIAFEEGRWQPLGLNLVEEQS